MKFKKEDLIDLVYDDTPDGFEKIKSEIIETSRWSLLSEIVFKYDGKFYCTSYTEGLTENQDESPFEYDDDEIECQEVFPKEKTITIYTPEP